MMPPRRMSLRAASMMLLCVAIMLIQVDCKPTVPSGYLSLGVMEDILYDYHLAEALSRDLPEDTAAMISFKANILKKYGVSEAEFDSSMLYYTRHTELLHKVYKSLSDRFSNEAMAQGASVNELDRFGTITSSADTADVWNARKELLLFPDAAFNSYSFRMKPDSTFHKGDVIMLDFDTHFHYQDGMRSATAVLAVRFGNDSVAMRSMQMTTSSHFHMRIEDGDTLGIKEMKGCFLLNIDKSDFNSTTLKMLSVSNIRMTRMHKSGEADAKRPDDERKDTLAAPAADVPHRAAKVDTARLAIPVSEAPIRKLPPPNK